jgi:hypothetical protein
VEWKRGEYIQLQKNSDYWNLPEVLPGNRWKASTPTAATTATSASPVTSVASVTAETSAPPPADQTLEIIAEIIAVIIVIGIGFVAFRRRRKTVQDIGWLEISPLKNLSLPVFLISCLDKERREICKGILQGDALDETWDNRT